MSQYSSTFDSPMRKELRSEIRERAMTPQAVLRRLKSKRPVERDAVLVVDRSRWMLIAFVAIGLCFVLFFMYQRANEQMQDDTKLMYVRMYPDGHWNIDFYDGGSRGTEFLPATVDSLITQWTQRRFQEVQASVEYDYGFASLFMDPKVSQAFIDPKQGNAAARASEIHACKECIEKQIEVRTIDHFDAEPTKFGQIPGALYRTNVFLREKYIDSAGSNSDNKHKILTLQWRLMSKEEIEANVRRKGGVDWLRLNPIGLQVMNYELRDDPSAAIANSDTAAQG